MSVEKHAWLAERRRAATKAEQPEPTDGDATATPEAVVVSSSEEA